ncbi:MAG TPA: hypothetical protein DEB05_15665, partial [Firmicutes bacterium]|nr:hypothetical protein [Bacillota bacterium]
RIIYIFVDFFSIPAQPVKGSTSGLKSFIIITKRQFIQFRTGGTRSFLGQFPFSNCNAKIKNNRTGTVVRAGENSALQLSAVFC